MRKVPSVAYGIDIGVYRHRKGGVVRSTSTFAWGRADANTKLLGSGDEHTPEFWIAGDYSSGTDMRLLAQSIDEDLRAGLSIAIGIEAPMWQPAPTAIPNGSFDLFPIRFAEEQGYAWYMQSGASALARALSTGRLLFSLLNFDAAKIQCSTTPGIADTNIELFEGFVAGNWKLKRHHEPEFGAHAQDALTTAVAYHYARRRDDANLSLIHANDSYRTPVISHWHTILQTAGIQSSKCNTDCMVVGFESISPELRDYVSGSGTSIEAERGEATCS